MTDPLSKAAGHLLSCLPQDGKPVGNIVLRRSSELSEEKFEDAREELIARGLAVPGKGKGGALRRVVGKGRAYYADFPEDSLADPFSRAAKGALSERLERTENEARELENQLWTLVYYLKPIVIATDRNPAIQLDKQQFRPDVCAIFDGFLLVADCKNTKHGTYVADWLDKVEEVRGELASISRRFELEQVIYLCVVADVSKIELRVQDRARRLSVKLIDSRKVSYYTTVYREVGIGVRDMFWGEVAPRIIHLRDDEVPALAVKIGKKREAFVFSVNAHLLLPRALVSHREVHDPDGAIKGYQRMLSKSRLKAIAKHIQTYKTFPTPIVVVLDKNVRFDPGKADQATARNRLGHLWLPGKPRSIQIVDGQHRLFGYSLVAWDDDHILHVIGYRSAPDLDPARMFVDINSKQKPVTSGLMWELFPDIYDQEHPDHFRAMVSVAVESSLGPLKKRVRHITSGSRGPITFAALCAEVVKAKLVSLVRSKVDDVDAQGKRLRQWLHVFFSTLVELEREFPKPVTNLLLRNVGIIPSLRLFGRMLIFEGELGKNAEILRGGPGLERVSSGYFRVLCKFYDQKDLSELERLRSQGSSQGGYKRLYDEFVEVIENHYGPGFGGPRNSPQLVSAVERVISAVEDVNRVGTSLGRTNSHIFKEFDGSDLTRLAKKRLEPDSLEKLVNTLYEEVVEGSGDNNPNNRLARILGIGELFQIEALRSLSLLRIYFSHKPGQIEAGKRQAAVGALQQFLGAPFPVDPATLTPEQCETVACELLGKIHATVLQPALAAMQGPAVSP